MGSYSAYLLLLKENAIAYNKLLEEQVNILKVALEQISNIPNRLKGPDWEEIEEARKIANDALKKINSKNNSEIISGAPFDEENTFNPDK